MKSSQILGIKNFQSNINPRKIKLKINMQDFRIIHTLAFR